MISVLWRVSAVYAGTLLLMAGTSLLGILLPLAMSRNGISTETIGLVMAAYYAGLMFGARYAMAVITTIGHIRAFAGFAAVVCAVVLTHPLWVDPIVWTVLRLVTGFCLAGLFAVMESWLNDSSTNATRGRVLSVYLMVTYVSSTGGQLMVNAWDVWQFIPYMIAAIIICLSLVPVVITREAAPDISQVQRLKLTELFRISPLSVVGTLCSGMLMGGFYGMGAVYGKLVQFDVLGISLFLSALVVGGFLLQFPIGKLSDVFDRRTVMAAVMAIAAALSLAGVFLPSFTSNFWAFVALAALVGGPFSVVYPLALGQAFDYLPKERYVAASGGLLLSYAVGATLGPIVVSFFMGHFGPTAFFAYFSAVCFLLFCFVLYRMRVRSALPPRAQEVYRAVPALSPMAAELDPRASAPGRPASAGPAEPPPAPADPRPADPRPA